MDISKRKLIPINDKATEKYNIKNKIHLNNRTKVNTSGIRDSIIAIKLPDL
ncbi:hypothetical protein VCHA54P500_80167 [Vibrio chagasii]|nr:hypothetical protein VCHA34P117_80166 [Vibrio chagasii]CAH7325257.1 hypothetical protein VCHA48P439_80032 [Vibrio chagasii]CAH7363662.1 hypothetical protein VCHA40O236_80156 [Vibrio chagasii]CAH7411955.1 hypothetical protein VCHA54P500_80167 [Vibrio chagasii]CAH7476052.1 hypothetical protein VCHA53O462_80032 [Vibrio chagasii]